jgi:hypothetical protein
MSKPSKEIIDRLKNEEEDPEGYHGTFDSLMEDKLMELDPEWMDAMKKIAEDSEVPFWYA